MTADEPRTSGRHRPPADRRVAAPTFPPATEGDNLHRPPRLILRFALYSAVALAIAGAGILLFVRQHAIAQAEQSVAFHARFVTDSVLRGRLRADDFRGRLGPRRRRALEAILEREVLVGGTLAVRLLGRDGRVAYSTNGGATAPADVSPDAIASEIEVRGGRKVLATYVPVRLGGAETAGVVAVDQDYAPIARAARKAFLPIAAVLELALLGLYVSLFPILRRVTQRLRGQLRQIEHQALHDGLTGLPNRDLFRTRVHEALIRAQERRTGAAVLLLDLDRFKEINDTLGHQSGDRLLQTLAHRLSALVRSTDTVARLGGDEFAIVSPGATDAAAATALAERIRRGLEEPFVVSGLTLEVEASIGIALFPGDGDDVEALIRHADVALYVSKDAHRPVLYAPKDDHYSPARLALVGELRRAIDAGELVVHYQPRADLRSGRVRGVEALVRWEHPQRGLLHPSQFIPVAEHTGLIRPLTRAVIETALRDCSRWLGEGYEAGVSVNLAARDLLDLELADEVEALLRRFGLEARMLELELTENTILSDPERAASVLKRLRALGVGLAIDDFGTGYSSLGHLKRLPVDVLKIDKSFVLGMAADTNDDVIVRSTIELGHNLGLTVVAEGVETQATWARLAELGCDVAQGFAISPPLPEAELRDWLAERGGANGRRLAAGAANL